MYISIQQLDGYKIMLEDKEIKYLKMSDGWCQRNIDDLLELLNSSYKKPEEESIDINDDDFDDGYEQGWADAKADSNKV